MKKLKKILKYIQIALGLLALVLVAMNYEYLMVKEEFETSTSLKKEVSQNPSSPVKDEGQENTEAASNQQLPPAKKSLTSLKKITKAFSQIASDNYHSQDFIDKLETLKLEPSVSQTMHPRRGVLRIIRTENNLPGTRYFHAQFFGSGDDEIMQHFSFEYQKGEKSFEEVIAEAKRSFAILPKTEYQSDGFISWDISDDHNLWIKVLNKKDMQNDPFNAYDLANDIGTIRLAVELKIH